MKKRLMAMAVAVLALLWCGSALAGWELLPGEAHDIGVGADGSVWVIGDDEVKGGFGIYRWNGRAWERTNGAAIRIAVGPKGDPWVVNSKKQIFSRAGLGWELLPGKAHDIGVGPEGGAWVIGADEVKGGFGIYRWNGRAWERTSGAAIAISVGPKGTPWVVNDRKQIFRRYTGE
ncbi:MAG: hypothetical protein JRC92_08695 [Deltaproteobacteria bacterium]|nr:hypothetical protein [Deltaproteobacteria bacterium]